MAYEIGPDIPGFPEEIRNKFLRLNVRHEKGGEPVPHKPLLVLIMLMRLRNEGVEETQFTDVRDSLTDIIRALPSADQGKSQPLPAYPFWLLKNDGIWAVTKNNQRVEPHLVVDVSSGRERPNEKKMLDANPDGGFTKDVLKPLKAFPELIDILANQIIARYFEKSQRTLIRQLIGYYETASSSQLVFNKNVYKAYQSQCSICRRRHKRFFNKLIELHATPIMPDAKIINVSARHGIAFCNLHSTLFRSGLITFVADGDNYALEVSKQPLQHYSRPISRIYRKPGFDINKLRGKKIFIPTDKAERPSQQLLQLHNNSIFLG